MLAISGGLFVDYFTPNVDQPLDLIISVGAPSARAAARKDLFPTTPMIFRWHSKDLCQPGRHHLNKIENAWTPQAQWTVHLLADFLASDLRVRHSRRSRSMATWVSLSSRDGAELTVVLGASQLVPETPAVCDCWKSFLSIEAS